MWIFVQIQRGSGLAYRRLNTELLILSEARDLRGIGSKPCARGLPGTAEVSDFAAASRQIAASRCSCAPTPSAEAGSAVAGQNRNEGLGVFDSDRIDWAPTSRFRPEPLERH